MKFFIDTGNPEEIKAAKEMGVLDGVTTNPSLISKENKPYKELLKEICEICEGPVSAEVTATDTDGMLKEAADLAKIADNIVIKVPIIKSGVSVIKKLTTDGIKVNVTLCFNSMQALIAATRNCADLCEVSDKLGTVEKGKIADLIVVEGNPLDNISNLRTLKMVLKDGKKVNLDKNEGQASFWQLYFLK